MVLSLPLELAVEEAAVVESVTLEVAETVVDKAELEVRSVVVVAAALGV